MKTRSDLDGNSATDYLSNPRIGAFEGAPSFRTGKRILHARIDDPKLKIEPIAVFIRGSGRSAIRARPGGENAARMNSHHRRG